MTHCDVLVIGAGPAGSAAAITLSRLGRRVVLVDRSRFPRDKACGDALIPDSLAAIHKLQLTDRLAKGSRFVHELKVFAPNGTEVRLRGRFACQRREQFDWMLQQEALAAGATFFGPFTVTGPRLRGGRVAGASLAHARTGESIDVDARVTLLATGAAAKPLQMFDVCTRPQPSAIAARAYFRLPQDLADQAQSLVISYDRAICPGYGWIFPGPDNVFNLGVGVFTDSPHDAGVPNLRQLFDRFLAKFPPAARISDAAERLSDLKGAPLRMAMTGARFHRPGLLVIGEAAGLTFSFSGEGIGKAMESGIIAAELAHEHFAADAGAADLGERYEAALRDRFSAVFGAYRTVQNWLSRPAICNLLAWRANRSPYVVRQLEGMLSETADPSELFSLSGLARSLSS